MSATAIFWHASTSSIRTVSDPTTKRRDQCSMARRCYSELWCSNLHIRTLPHRCNPQRAANILGRAGWTEIDTNKTRAGRFLSGLPVIAHCCLRPPNWLESYQTIEQAPPPPMLHAPPTTTVLLSANDCNLSIESLDWPSLQMAGFVPPLPYLLDGLITGVLDATPESERESRIAIQLVYLYAHCKEISSPKFGDRLKYENRQFHVDSLTGLLVGNIRIIAWGRLVRRGLLEGTRQLVSDNSLSRAQPSEVQHCTGLAYMHSLMQPSPV